MKYNFNFSNMPDYVLIKTGEFAVVDDFYKLLNNLAASTRWVKGAGLIIDHQLLNLSKMTFAEIKMIQSIIEFNAPKLGADKCAFVIGNQKTDLAAKLTSQSDSEFPSTIKIFSSLATAKKWVAP